MQNTSFDGYKDDALYAIRDPGGGRARGSIHPRPLRHERRHAAQRCLEDRPGHRGQVPRAKLGIHAHDDAGVAVANSLLAVEAGATHVQGTFNGLGERCGNADLSAIIPDLILKMGRETSQGRETLPSSRNGALHQHPWPTASSRKTIPTSGKWLLPTREAFT